MAQTAGSQRRCPGTPAGEDHQHGQGDHQQATKDDQRLAAGEPGSTDLDEQTKEPAVIGTQTIFSPVSALTHEAGSLAQLNGSGQRGY